MSRMNGILLSSGVVLGSFGLLLLLSFFVGNWGNKKSVDILKNIDISHNSHLISPIISELHHITGKREPSLRFPDTGGRMKLSNSFQKLQEAGKATEEEVRAIKEFEEAIDGLSKAIQRLDSIPSLRREMRL